MERPASSRAPTLPNELLLESFKFLAEDKSLERHFRIVSKRFNNLITPLVYVSWVLTKRVCSIFNKDGLRRIRSFESLGPVDLVNFLTNVRRYAEQVVVPPSCEYWAAVLANMDLQRFKRIQLSEVECGRMGTVTTLVYLVRIYPNIDIHLVNLTCHCSNVISSINKSRLPNIITFEMTSDKISRECINDLELFLINQKLQRLKIDDVSSARSLPDDSGQRRLIKFHGRSFAALKQLELRSCDWAFDKDQITGQWDFSRMTMLQLYECDMQHFLDAVNAGQLQQLRVFHCTDVLEGFLNYSMTPDSVQRRKSLNDRVLQLACCLKRLQDLEIRVQSPSQALCRLAEHQLGLPKLNLRINAPPSEAREFYQPTQSLYETARSFTELTSLTLEFPWIRVPCTNNDIQFLCNDRGDDAYIQVEQWPQNLCMARNLQHLSFYTQCLVDDVQVRGPIVPGHEHCHLDGPQKVRKFFNRIINDLISLKLGRLLACIEICATLRTHVNVASEDRESFETRSVIKNVTVKYGGDGSGEPPHGEICTFISEYLPE